MGLIQAAVGSFKGVMGDQWKEYFVCDSIPAGTIVVKGKKKISGKSSNRSKDDIITNGSVISVADGQAIIIVDNGKVVDYCAEPGEYTFDQSTEPSLFDGGKLADNIKEVFANMGKRFAFGGEAPKDMRVYYFNLKEQMGNKFGTPNPVPFRVVDDRANIDMDVRIKCFGEYSIHVTNPILFYTNVCGNVKDECTVDDIGSQMKSEFLTAFQPALAILGRNRLRYSDLPLYTKELASVLNDELSTQWRDGRGIEIGRVGINSIVADKEDEETLQSLQKAASFRDPGLAAGYTVSQQGKAMVDAANNANGAVNGFVGMNMAGSAMGNTATTLYAQAAAEKAAPQAGGWTCACGANNPAEANFCMKCGKPNPTGPWTCECGQENPAGSNFCMKCGKPRK